MARGVRLMKWVEPLERFVEGLVVLWLISLFYKRRSPSSQRSSYKANEANQAKSKGVVMLTIGVENIGDMAVIECKGQLVRSDAAFKLRQAAMSQVKARIMVLDLTEVDAIESDGVNSLAALQNWALDRNIQLKLYGASNSVKEKLEANGSVQFDFAPFKQMVALLSLAESQQHAKAA